MEKRDVYLLFHPPVGTAPTNNDAGWDDNLDSDVDGTYGPNTTKMYSLQPCLLYTSPSPRDKRQSRMPSSA